MTSQRRQTSSISARPSQRSLLSTALALSIFTVLGFFLFLALPAINKIVPVGDSGMIFYVLGCLAVVSIMRRRSKGQGPVARGDDSEPCGETEKRSEPRSPADPHMDSVRARLRGIKGRKRAANSANDMERG